MKIIIIGDFNVDIQLERNRTFLDVFEKYNFDFKLPNYKSAMNSNAQIDLCFANCVLLLSKYYENRGYYKAITCV